jgi:cell division protein FtsW (lipid II flippase)
MALTGCRTVAEIETPVKVCAAVMLVVPVLLIAKQPDLGTAVTLLLVNIFPARRARDILMLMGLLFAGSLIVLLRMIKPEQLMHVESLPDVTDFFATLLRGAVEIAQAGGPSPVQIGHRHLKQPDQMGC